jgi:hypothetical protein
MLCKAYGTKWGAIWEYVGEHIGNLGILWEHIKNDKKKKKTKKISPTHPLKRKNQTFECLLQSSLVEHNFHSQLYSSPILA